MNEITRHLAHNLGFDEYGQLNVRWHEGESTCSTIITDMRGKTCPICKKGWELTAESFRNQTRTSFMDEWCHTTCYRGYLEMKETATWYRLMVDPPEMIPFDWRKIPNEYGGAWQTPWFLITYPGYIPTLKVGARKRVDHMSLHDLRREQIDAFLEKVNDVTSTKGESGNNSVYIHAWNEKEAARYLQHFWEVIRMDKPKPGTLCAEHEEKRLQRLAEKKPEQQAA